MLAPHTCASRSVLSPYLPPFSLPDVSSLPASPLSPLAHGSSSSTHYAPSSSAPYASSTSPGPAKPPPPTPPAPQ
eukprot:84229-Rhodomonas_salina.2